MAAAQPIHRESIVGDGVLRARLQQYGAQIQQSYSTADRLVYWAPAQRAWMTVERSADGSFLLQLYGECPCSKTT